MNGGWRLHQPGRSLPRFFQLWHVDGEPAPFTRRLHGGERVAVYPVFECFDVSGLAALRPHPLREPRFVLDVHLGRLASYLRLLGFDCLYRNDYDDDELIAISHREHRTVLTRDTGLLKRAELMSQEIERRLLALQQQVARLRSSEEAA